MVGPREELLTQVESLSTEFIAELRHRSAGEPVNSAAWPTVGSLAGHVASVHGWVTTIVRTGSQVARDESTLDDPSMVAVFQGARDRLLSELRREDRRCWIIGDHGGSTDLWRCRMAIETLRHLMDARTKPGATFVIPPSFTTATAVDGIDEFFEVFLPRGRPSLSPLPGAVNLVASDIDRSWALSPDCSISAGEVMPDPGSTVTVPASALALLFWERASALDEPTHFAISGTRGGVVALEAARIHR